MRVREETTARGNAVSTRATAKAARAKDKMDEEETSSEAEPEELGQLGRKSLPEDEETESHEEDGEGYPTQWGVTGGDTNPWGTTPSVLPRGSAGEPHREGTRKYMEEIIRKKQREIIEEARVAEERPMSDENRRSEEGPTSEERRAPEERRELEQQPTLDERGGVPGEPEERAPVTWEDLTAIMKASSEGHEKGRRGAAQTIARPLRGVGNNELNAWWDQVMEYRRAGGNAPAAQFIQTEALYVIQNHANCRKYGRRIEENWTGQDVGYIHERLKEMRDQELITFLRAGTVTKITLLTLEEEYQVGLRKLQITHVNAANQEEWQREVNGLMAEFGRTSDQIRLKKYDIELGEEGKTRILLGAFSRGHRRVYEVLKAGFRGKAIKTVKQLMVEVHQQMNRVASAIDLLDGGTEERPKGSRGHGAEERNRGLQKDRGYQRDRKPDEGCGRRESAHWERKPVPERKPVNTNPKRKRDISDSTFGKLKERKACADYYEGKCTRTKCNFIHMNRAEIDALPEVPDKRK